MPMVVSETVTEAPGSAVKGVPNPMSAGSSCPTRMALLTLAALSTVGLAAESPRSIVLLAGGRSHGYGTHEHYGGCMLLARLLNEHAPGVLAVVHRGCPKDPAVVGSASALVLCCDGGVHGVVGRHLAEVGKLVERGGGMACFHYALAEPKGERGDRMLRWIGGYYETHWSVNPIWTAGFKSLPKHPITRGVRPFAIKDEWYYHMRFVKDMKGVTPILSAVPPDSTRKRPFGAHSGNPHVRARMGMPEHVAWAYERPGGGRGFGLTGVHWHWNWAHDDFRKLALNALVWIAGAEVPPDGVPSKTPTVAELAANLDNPKQKNWRPEPLLRMIEQFNRPAER